MEQMVDFKGTPGHGPIYHATLRESMPVGPALTYGLCCQLLSLGSMWIYIDFYVFVCDRMKLYWFLLLHLDSYSSGYRFICVCFDLYDFGLMYVDLYRTRLLYFEFYQIILNLYIEVCWLVLICIECILIYMGLYGPTGPIGPGGRHDRRVHFQVFL